MHLLDDAVLGTLLELRYSEKWDHKTLIIPLISFADVNSGDKRISKVQEWLNQEFLNNPPFKIIEIFDENISDTISRLINQKENDKILRSKIMAEQVVTSHGSHTSRKSRKDFIDDQIESLRALQEKVATGSEQAISLAKVFFKMEADLEKNVHFAAEFTKEGKAILDNYLEQYIQHYSDPKRPLRGQEELESSAFLATKMYNVLLRPDFQTMYTKTNVTFPPKYLGISTEFFCHNMIYLQFRNYLKIRGFRFKGYKPQYSQVSPRKQPIPEYCWNAVIDNLVPSTASTTNQTQPQIECKKTQSGKYSLYSFAFGQPVQLETGGPQQLMFQKLLEHYGQMVENSELPQGKNQPGNTLKDLNKKLSAANLSDYVHIFSKKQGGYYLVIRHPEASVIITTN